MYAHQWDETSQRYKTVTSQGADNKLVSKQKLAAQIMVNTGQIAFFVDGGGRSSVESHPSFCSALELKKTTADFLIESVLEALPFTYEDAQVVADMMSELLLFVLSLTVDRASANLSTGNWFAVHALQHSPRLLP